MSVAASNLSSEKLARKRVLDRRAQKAARDRTKWTIDNLQYQVAQLNNALITETKRLQDLLQASSKENETIRAENSRLKAHIEGSAFATLGFSEDLLAQDPFAHKEGEDSDDLTISSMLGSPSCKAELFEAMPWNTGPTCLSDRILQSYVATARIHNNKTDNMIIKAQPDVSSLLNPNRDTHSHGVSMVVSDIILAYQEINTLPTKVACLYVMHKFLNVGAL